MKTEDKILLKINQLDMYIQKYEDLVPNSEIEYNASEVHRLATERLLQVSIECVLDICSLLVKLLRLGPPKTEDHILDLLIPHFKIIPKIKEMKKFRNRLVHMYDDLSDSMIYVYATVDYNEFSDFNEEIKNFIVEYKNKTKKERE